METQLYPGWTAGYLRAANPDLWACELLRTRAAADHALDEAGDVFLG